jgi:protein-tyrosine-phosphatase
MRVKKVLLVCTGNTCRSPMAAGLLRRIWQEANPGWYLEVSSAGTGAFPGLDASEHAVDVMKERQVDIADHRSRPLTAELLTEADLVLTMTRRHKEQILALFPGAEGKVYSLGEYTGSGADVPDPFGGSRDDYARTAEALDRYLRQVVERICREGTGA